MEQQEYFSKEEQALFKATFKKNLPLLNSLRKFVLQLPLSERDEVILRRQIKGDVLKVVKKCFLPEINGDGIILLNSDLWQSMSGGVQNFMQIAPDTAILQIKSREKLIEYFTEVFKDLEGKKYDRISFKDLTDMKGTPEDIYINTITRNLIALLTEQELNRINTLANKVDETPETLEKKAIQDSSK
jgi:hypothetical protein